MILLRRKEACRMKIKVPYIIDDPIVGRTLSPTVMGLVGSMSIIFPRDYIMRDGDDLIYHHSSKRRIDSFKINSTSRFVVQNRTFSFWDKEFKLKQLRPGERSGVETTLLLIDFEEKSHVLIPPFHISRWQKTWNRFLIKLSKNIGLQVQEFNIHEDG